MKTYVLHKQGGIPEFSIDYDAELNGEQLDVVKNGDGPCLVLAGAGSGKTRTIVYRVAYLIEKGVAPGEILLLTFTNKAAKEMLERVSSLIGAEPGRMWGGTFHHVCHRILRERGVRVGLREGFTILDAEDARDLMKSCVREAGVDTKAKRFPSPAVLLSLASYSVNAGMPVADVVEAKHPSFRDILPSIEEVVSAYLRKKRASNAVDFDDLLSLAARLLREDADTRERYARQFRYILVDEYQDTNRLQAEIVRLLASVHGNVLVVGDDAQSIYSFRGADIRNILEFPRIFPGAKTFRLETNYRSTPEILDLANDIIGRNANQFPKDLKSVKPPFAKPSLVNAASGAQEAEFIAQRMLELRDEGVAFDNMAALFRATFHSQALEFELMKRGIPYDYRGGAKFFDRAHIKDAISFLKIMVNKDDEVAWMRVLSLQVGIGPVAAMKLFERVRAASHEDDIGPELVAGLPARISGGWKRFVEVYDALRDARPSPSSMLRAVADSDYKAYLENEYPDYRDRLEDLEQLAGFAESYPDAAAFLSDAALRDDIASAGKNARILSAEDDSEGKVVLSTIHQAKGLEWDAVFVIHMTQGAFPNKRALLDDGGIEEERRLFYVACTRARRDLCLSYPLSVGYDAFSFEPKSEFLEEISGGLVEDVRIEESYDDLPTITYDEHGNPKKMPSLLRDVGEY
ncbi:MAG TPA: UvrD-helicase domain-containing protein [Patescibacteria group bacterium]|nr:UvrD-helicase domain-containing protein [Patescibacteria group bacterium]